MTGLVLGDTEVDGLGDFFEDEGLEDTEGAIELKMVLEVDVLYGCENREQVCFEGRLLLRVIQSANILSLKIFIS